MADLQRERTARIWARAMALGSFIAFVPPIQWSMAQGASFGEALWSLLRAFTITTNALIVIVFGLIAWRGRGAVSSQWTGGVALAILLVGIVFNLVLGQIPQHSWFGRFGDSMHHHVMPVLVPLWWLVHAEKGRLNWRSPFLWALYPLGYSAYALTRAALEPAGTPGRYPYFFMDVETLGWIPALVNMGVIALGFVLAGLGVVALDRRLARRG